MGLFIYRFQFLNRVVCVNLRGRQVGMPENFLDGIEVGTIVQHMGGKCMPDDMRTAFADRGDLVEVMMNQPLNKPGIKLLAFIGEE